MDSFNKKLEKIQVRFFPPGLILEFKDGSGLIENKSIDLLNLSENSDIDYLITEINKKEPLTIKHSKKLEKVIQKLIDITSEKPRQKYTLKNTLKCHELPLTNCAFNKNGSRFITGSYDRTCIIWDTQSGELLQKLIGHSNVVYSISFNLPYGDKVATGSFDKTAKLWNVQNGNCLTTLNGHNMEIVCLQFDPMSQLLLTGSMDKTAKLWNLETEQEIFQLEHEGEVISASFNMDGDKILTGSFDKTAKIWDTYNGSLIADLDEHTAEISACQFNYSGTQVITSSIDKD
jgi:dynein assembly factor with WDR repeat domains 1